MPDYWLDLMTVPVPMWVASALLIAISRVFRNDTPAAAALVLTVLATFAAMAIGVSHQERPLRDCRESGSQMGALSDSEGTREQAG
jgi:hypothetical protein